MIKDQRVLRLEGEGRHEDAESEETTRDAAALDILRALVALEKTMPDLFDRLRDVK